MTTRLCLEPLEDRCLCDAALASIWGPGVIVPVTQQVGNLLAQTAQMAKTSIVVALLAAPGQGTLGNVTAALPGLISSYVSAVEGAIGSYIAGIEALLAQLEAIPHVPNQEVLAPLAAQILHFQFATFTAAAAATAGVPNPFAAF